MAHDPASAPDMAPPGRPWPEPPAPPIARECRLIEVFLGDRLRPAGPFALRVLPGHAAEIRFRQAGRDGDGDEFPTERIAFRPADARELLRDLARVVAELDQIGPPPDDRDRGEVPPSWPGPGGAGQAR